MTLAASGCRSDAEQSSITERELFASTSAVPSRSECSYSLRMPNGRSCTRCKRRRPATDFYAHKNGRKRGVCKVCFCEETRRNRARVARTQPERVMLLAARKRARAARVPFAIKETDFRIPRSCPVLGILLMSNQGRRGPNDASPTLDRIVPWRGYVPGNVVVVSWRANRLKSDASVYELARIAEWYRRAEYRGRADKTRRSPTVHAARRVHAER
jgi:hypothetical protein